MIESLKYKAEILSRCVAAIFGGYVFSSILSLALIPILVNTSGLTLGDSVLAAAMLSYVSYFVVIVISFCRFNHWKIWAVLLFLTSALLSVHRVFSLS